MEDKIPCSVRLQREKVEPTQFLRALLYNLPEGGLRKRPPEIRVQAYHVGDGIGGDFFLSPPPNQWRAKKSANLCGG